MMNVKVTMRLMRLVQRSYSVALIVLPPIAQQLSTIAS